jgi:glucan phosphoethanolaminetransferase (alkaline phosphatase superfamily)
MTVGALAAVAIFVLASLIWRGLFAVPAPVAMLVSVVLLPVAGIWWVLDAARWWLRSPESEAGLRRSVSGTLAAAWVSLTVLLPAVFAWVWADRVSWIVF